MILTDLDKQSILRDFPISFSELSYDTMAHKKVHDADIMIAVPEGKQCIAWFTSFKQFDACFLLELNEETRSITNITILQTGFHFKLSFGTILHGTFFKWKNTNCFSVYDIYSYKGKNVSNSNYNEKLVMINNMLTNDISQLAIHGSYTIFGFPLISNNFQQLLIDVEQLPYKINKIKFKYFTSKKSLYIKYYKPGTINNSSNLISNTFVFKVTPDIQNDIYNLLVYNNGKDELYETAFIPDYKTSVMMNKLFRNIKENKNLDALEESDDEDEFENEKLDKYVYLNKSYKMECEYNIKFNKWVPIKKVENQSEKIVTLNTLRNNKQEYVNKNTYYSNNNRYTTNNSNNNAFVKSYNKNTNNNYNKNTNNNYNKNINNIYNVANKSR